MKKLLALALLFCVLFCAAPVEAQMLLFFSGSGSSGGGAAVPATGYTASGPSTGTAGSASTNFTVTATGGTFTGSQTITIGDGTKGGTITPSVGSPGTSTVTVTPAANSSSFTFTYTAVFGDAITLSFTNGQAWSNPSSLPYTGAVTYTMSGPSTGAVNAASTAFTVSMPASVKFSGTDTVTLGDGSRGGTFTPSVGGTGVSTVTVTPAANATSFTFTYTPVVIATVTLTPTNAQSWTNPATLNYASTTSYVGPGDIVSTAKGFWGLRGYNTAYATGSNSAATVCDTSTGTTCTTVVILNTGAFDAATASGLSQCASSCSVTKLFDQSGNSKDMTCTPIATCPVLTFNCINTNLPCLTFTAASSMKLVAAGTAQAQPISFSAVSKRTGNFTTQQDTISTFSTSVNGCVTGYSSVTNDAYLYGGTQVNVVASNSAWHAINANCNTTTSGINVDGTDSGNINVNTHSGDTEWTLGAAYTSGSSYSGFLQGTMTEAGIWFVGFTSTQRGNLCHNQYTYWATSASC